MKTLHISHDFALPLDAVTQTFAVLAKRGVGKTYTASVMAEEMLKAGQPIIALDPTGAWWGLRSEFPVVIIGGEHADVPLEVSAGEVIAQSIVENRFPAVLDLSLLRKGQMIQFMVAFAETLYRLNREALHLFVDEADAFAPQAKNYGGEENRMLGAMEDIVRRGRKRGIGCTLITQRPAVLNKNVLTQCEVLIALRVVHPKDIGAIKEWVNVQADEEQAKVMISSLPSLPVGEAWFWSPGWGDFFELVKVRHRETFDSGATPKAGEVEKTPKKLAPIDVKALGQQIQATVEKAKANDPGALRRRIAQLEAEVAKKHPPSAAAKVETKRVEVPILKDSHVHGLERAAEKMKAAADELADVAAFITSTVTTAIAEAKKLSSPAPAVPAQLGGGRMPITALAHSIASARPQRANSQTATPIDGELSNYARSLLVTFAQRHPMTLSRSQLAILSGRSTRSSAFDGAVAQIKRGAYVEEVGGGTMRLTEAGIAAVGGVTAAPQTSAELLETWRRALPAYECALFDVLVGVYPDDLTREQLAEKAGKSLTSSAFDGAISALKKNHLVVQRGTELAASDTLFDAAKGAA